MRGSLLAAYPEGSSPHIAIACSGGRDSVMLAHLLQSLVRTATITASIVHVDHAVRERSAEAAQMVEAFGASLGTPVHTVRLEPDASSRHEGAGIEEALRRERYAVFASVANEIGADAVALAHHQQDQAETVLLHLIRGAGLHGAAGMREWTVIDVPWWEHRRERLPLRLWRPLLTEPAAEVAAWHRAHDLPLSEDETNEDRTLRRNAIRLDVLPELETIFPGAVANLARFASLAAEDDDFLDQAAAERALVQPDGDLHRRAVVDVPRSIQRRVVQRWIFDGGYDGDLTSNRIDAVCELAERNRSGAMVELGSGWSVLITRGVLSLRR